MKVLVTGSSGMLGRALCEELSGQYEVLGLDIARAPGAEPGVEKFIECDITEREKTTSAIISLKPDILIHAAAYTNVDGCQLDVEKAQKVNAQGTQTIALAADKCNAFLCYISTDFVFDGEKKAAYIESDQPNPVNIYGESKLAGEKYVQSILEKFIVVRSSWLFGKGGKNFVDTFLKKGQNQKRIEVVNDQFGSPTYVKDLAQAINKLINSAAKLRGIYHVANSGSCSWYEFARTISELARLDTNVIAIPSDQYQSPTKRPKMSVLQNRRYQEDAGEELRHWKEALQEYLQDNFL